MAVFGGNNPLLSSVFSQVTHPYAPTNGAGAFGVSALSQLTSSKSVDNTGLLGFSSILGQSVGTPKVSAGTIPVDTQNVAAPQNPTMNIAQAISPQQDLLATPANVNVGTPQMIQTVPQSLPQPIQASVGGGGVSPLVGNIIGGASNIMDAINGSKGSANATDATVDSLRAGIQNKLIASGNPLLMGVGAGTKLLDTLGIKSDASEGLGSLEDAGNFALSLTGVGGIAGALMGKTPEAIESERVGQSSSYGAIENSDTYKTAHKNDGANIVFGRSKAEQAINESNRQVRLAEQILNEADENAQAKRYTMPLINSRNISRLAGSMNMLGSAQGVRVGKEGMKVPESSQESSVASFKKGGNIIPSGALHARKNHLEAVDTELSGQVTSKGIPVITKEGGKIIQHAEIEVAELIFNQKTTEKLEKYHEKWLKLQEAGEDFSTEIKNLEVRCGKFLVEEILENTDDRIGLIKEIEA